jgi:DNA-binding response OmpR family regulator
MTLPPSLLIVDDDRELGQMLTEYLTGEGFQVTLLRDGAEALEKLTDQSHPFDLVILDVMLPSLSGFEVLRRLRHSLSVPVIMLTAHGADVDRIVGLELGADDYLSKPFNPRELVARVKSILRRAAPERRRTESEELQHGDLTINAGKREVHVGDEEIRLAPKEFDLLWELLDHRGIVLTRDQLLERVWGYTFAGDTRTVDVHVRQIRRKLGDASPIVTVWGVGYKVASDRATATTL